MMADCKKLLAETIAPARVPPTLCLVYATYAPNFQNT